MNLKSAVKEFITAKKIENLSPKTIQIYESMLEELVEFLGSISVEEFSASDVRNFLQYQRERDGQFGKLSDATIHKYYAVTRTFSRWLTDQDYKEKSPTDKVNPPRVEDKLPEAMSDDEVDRLFNYLRSFSSDRIQIVFEFFLDTGARLAEVVGLDLKDVHLKDGWVKVYGKGRKERILPLGNRLKRDLETYINHLRPMIAKEDEGALFVTINGERYTRDGMSTLVKRKLKKANVEGRYGPHKLRHTFATNYLRNGGHIEQLRRILGHTDISTTQRYISLLPEDLYNAHKTVSPADSIFKRLG
jgi:integrase/recombinase XerD